MLRPLRAARGQKPGVQFPAIDVHNHAMPLPLLEWFERTRLSARTGPRRPWVISRVWWSIRQTQSRRGIRSQWRIVRQQPRHKHL